MHGDDVLKETLSTWQPYYPEPLGENEALEIHANWSAYLRLISDWTEELSLCVP
jgi:hypothetical protein